MSTLRERREALVREHMESENRHAFDVTLATFSHPRYEIVPTGDVHEGVEAVLAYHRNQRTAFPDQRHENVRMHVSDDDTIIAEFDLLGTNLGEFMGAAPTGKSFRLPVVAVFFFEGDKITNERVYLDLASMLTQIGRTDLFALLT